MRRLISVTVFALCVPYLSGCIFPYYAYPTLDSTPAVKLGTQPGEVRAFRVDITRNRADLQKEASLISETLEEIPVINSDEVASQIKTGISYGLVVIGLALNFTSETSHSFAVRVYRPGYELIEIKSVEKINRVLWKPVSDLKDQEAAIDSLLGQGYHNGAAKPAAHIKAMQFVANEYGRLASSATSLDDRKRLEEKSAILLKREE